MESSIEHARSAVEADPNEVRHWHLLGLLLAATGDWRAAKGVLEVGIGMAEADLTESDRTPADGIAGGISIRDFGRGTMSNGVDHSHGVNGHSASHQPNGHSISATIVPANATVIPSSSCLLQPVKDRPAPTRQESFEYALQMRMTQVALTEFVEGAEGVGDKWLEVFQWFREKRPATMDDRTYHVNRSSSILTIKLHRAQIYR